MHVINVKFSVCSICLFVDFQRLLIYGEFFIPVHTNYVHKLFHSYCDDSQDDGLKVLFNSKWMCFHV